MRKSFATYQFSSSKYHLNLMKQHFSKTLVYLRYVRGYQENSHPENSHPSNSPWKIPTQKIPTWNIPTHVFIPATVIIDIT